MSYPEKLALTDKAHPKISISRQADLLGISRSSIYYEPAVNPENIKIMNAIDEIFTKRPFYGHRRIRWDLRDYYNIFIGRKRALSLMKNMGLEAIYPKKKINLSHPGKSHKRFPYLLRNLNIIRPNQVWGTDITYIRTRNGFVYLSAILDWFSRYVLSWKLSQTLESDFCVDVLEQALNLNIPDFHNSDLGVQYTSIDYVNILEKAKVNISMDGRGRCMDNIFTERLWRTVKYENVYLNEYQNIDEAAHGLSKYFKFYNEERRHQSLGEKVPAEIYFS